MDALRAAEALRLPDWMIGAGFVRNKVWDHLHDYHTLHRGSDIDLIYFDKDAISPAKEQSYDKQLQKQFPAPWSTKNTARMAQVHGREAYTSSENALADWVETATCVAVKLDNGELCLVTPYGIEDLVNLVLRPAPRLNDPKRLHQRAKAKGWQKTWPKLTVIGA